MIEHIFNLSILFVVALIQNMAFTLVSRSRNSGNPVRHFKAAIGSNGIWFICNYFILFPEMMKVIEKGDLVLKMVYMVVYVLATTLGSTWMMKMNLGQTEGVPWLFKRVAKYFLEKDDSSKVGSRGK